MSVDPHENPGERDALREMLRRAHEDDGPVPSFDAMWSEAESRVRQNRSTKRLVLCGGLVALAAAIGFVVLSLPGDPDPAPEPTGTNTVNVEISGEPEIVQPPLYENVEPLLIASLQPLRLTASVSGSSPWFASPSDGMELDSLRPPVPSVWSEDLDWLPLLEGGKE